MLETGIKGKETSEVTSQNTAKALGSGDLEVYATPAMIALMEKTAATSVQPSIEAGWGTVGISINVKHTSATPIGATVICESRLTEVDGRRLVFELTASDDAGIIGTGTHERFIVNNDKFIKKVNEKIKF